VLLDCDTLTVSDYVDLNRESVEHILLYDVQHRLSHAHRMRVIENNRVICGEAVSLIHYGGEILCGPATLLRPFVANCAEFARTLRALCESRDVSAQDMGDEQLISMAAHRMATSIRIANAYLCRYWTGRNFRLLSTNYRFNAVDIWHLPAEKEGGLQTLYRHLVRHGEFPSSDACAKLAGLDRPNEGRVGSKWRRLRNRYWHG
jgi:hypothetical protein